MVNENESSVKLLDNDEIEQLKNDEINLKESKTAYELEPTKVKANSHMLDVSDLKSVVSYGSDLEHESAKRSSRMLEVVEESQIYDIDKHIKNLRKETSKASPEKLIVQEQSKIKRFVKNTTKSIKQELNLMTSISSKIDRIGHDLKLNAATLKKDADAMKEMNENSMMDVKSLDYLIAGIDQKLTQIDDNLIPEQKQAIENDDPYAMQELQNLNDFKDALWNKRQDLEASKMLALTSIAQLSMMYRVNYTLAQRIESNVTKNITQWKNQVTTSLFAYKSNSTINAAKTLEKETRQQIINNSNDIYRATVDTAEFANRTSVDPETIGYAFKRIEQAIEDVSRIQGKRIEQFEKNKEENAKLIEKYGQFVNYQKKGDAE